MITKKPQVRSPFPPFLDDPVAAGFSLYSVYIFIEDAAFLTIMRPPLFSVNPLSSSYSPITESSA